MAEIKTVRTSGIVPHVPIIEPLEATHNGLYVAPSGIDGYSPVNVQVQEQPWSPLQDGYSNFWFELTNDTLSPWLNFSAKNADAVIDWGDGSGEQALDTLTPTHTYSKAGKYVVKVKGVTGIGRQNRVPYSGEYLKALRYVELASEVTTIEAYGFSYCVALNRVIVPNSIVLNTSAFQGCTNLTEFVFPTLATTLPASLFFFNFSLCSEIVLPSTITAIEYYAFYYCLSLYKIHIQATTPPTLGNNVFYQLPNDFIIYVPVGYGDTYKSAAGWSAYSDHILEEGETPNT